MAKATTATTKANNARATKASYKKLLKAVKASLTPLRYYQVHLNAPAEDFLFNSNERKAQVYAPTGAGKTVAFMHILVEAIMRGFKKIAIVHPRIALSKDQLERFKKDVGNGVRTDSFHSGGHDNYGQTEREVGTTSRYELELVQSITNLEGKAHVTFSSYASFAKLADMDFDLVIFDEAHYIANYKDYRGWNETLAANKALYYTATPIGSEMEEANMFATDDDGNVIESKHFGKIIASVNPKELIVGGFIVAPLIHTVNAKLDGNGDVDIVDLVARAYVAQYKDVTKHGMPFSQMLVAARNVKEDLVALRENAAAINKKIAELDPSIGRVNVYDIAAEGAYINGKAQDDRKAALDKFVADKNAIIGHFDTLSEGIDISTLTGVLLMRELSKAKLIQTIGRCARPFIGDLDPVTKMPRADVFNPETGLDNRLKPRCIVTIPVVNGQWMGNSNGTSIAEAFIAAGYDNLSSYLPTAGDDATGTDNDDDDDGDIVDPVDERFTSNIKDFELHREIEDLEQAFDKFFDI